VGDADAGPGRHTEDCASPAPDKIEPACNAIINDVSRPADDRLKALVNRSRLFIARAKIDLALADAEAALLLNPKSVPALLLRGYARQRKGEAERASSDFDQAIELEPSNAVAYYSRGNLRNVERKFADAMTDLNQAITLRPDYA
jgi:tetratricopeptide (TPR) repeat protein